jgi:hypothetical protein
MKTIHAAATFVLTLAAISWSGCSSSGSASSAGGPSEMDQMAAALDRPGVAQPAVASSSITTATPADATTTATAASSPRPLTQTAQPPVADPSLRTKRGFGLKDWSNEAVYILVKADAAKTADALARTWNGKVLKNVYGKPASEQSDQVVIWQLAGHPWSIFATDGSQIEQLSAALSSDMDVLIIWNSDFNGWSGVDLFRAGKEVEAVHWGPEGDALGEDADVSKWHTKGQFAQTIEGEPYNETYQFRSTLRKVTEQDLQKGEPFVDAFLRHHDAYLPDVEQMPWGDEDNNTFTSPLGPAAFAGVHAVEVTSR